jgi:hypothetical protein
MGQNVGGAIRWVGGIALGGALIMLILGQTVLEGRLRALGFLTYWLVCFLLLGVAVVSALRDFRGLQHRMRQEQRSLLDATLKKIEADAISKSHQPQAGRGAKDVNGSKNPPPNDPA